MLFTLWESKGEAESVEGGMLYPYSRENEAYSVLWANSHDNDGKFIQESMAVLLNSGILILLNAGYIDGVFYKNVYDEAYYAEAWMKKYGYNNNDLWGTMHTHPEGYPSLEDKIPGLGFVMFEHEFVFNYYNSDQQEWKQITNFTDDNLPTSDQVRSNYSLYNIRVNLKLKFH
jgi:hypothetical protein